MSFIVKRGLTKNQLEAKAAKTKPSQEEILAAQDALFMSILNRLNELEVQNGDLSRLQHERLDSAE